MSRLDDPPEGECTAWDFTRIDSSHSLDTTGAMPQTGFREGQRAKMRKLLLAIAGLVVAATSCTTASNSNCPGMGPSRCAYGSAAQTTYHDPVGWSIVVPTGWAAGPFNASGGGLSGTGSQIANVNLPPPKIVPGSPLQANSRVLPATGISLVISNYNDPGVSVGTTTRPPLSVASFAQGSYPPGGYGLDAAWVSGNGLKLLATIRFGPNVSNHDMQQMSGILASFRFD